jgi:hypothetical protein
VQTYSDPSPNVAYGLRHPLYLVEEAAVAGVLLQYAWFAALPFLVLHVTVQIRRMQLEEKVLQKASGIRHIRAAHAAPYSRCVVIPCSPWRIRAASSCPENLGATE